MTIDSFMFFNEFECLAIRCEELRPLNPVHVLVESRHTFRGKPKPLLFETRKAEFSKYCIHHIVIDGLECDDPWEAERHQRDQTTAVVASDDIVILGDVDEIPRCEVVAGFTSDDVAELRLAHYQYFISRSPLSEPWPHARLCRGKHLETATATQIRRTAYPTIIADAGWHLSWLGGYHHYVEKLQSYSHSEHDTPEARRVEAWLDEVTKQPFGALRDLPKAVMDNPERFLNVLI